MNSRNEERLTTPHSQPSKALSNHGPIVPLSEPEGNEFTNVAMAFACRGHDLFRIDDEPPRYYVSYRGQALMANSWLAVKTLLAHIGRAA
jgi:hypothetical protein